MPLGNSTGKHIVVTVHILEPWPDLSFRPPFWGAIISNGDPNIFSCKITKGHALFLRMNEFVP